MLISIYNTIRFKVDSSAPAVILHEFLSKQTTKSNQVQSENLIHLSPKQSPNQGPKQGHPADHRNAIHY